MDISKQLQAYEVEYHVLQEELIDSSPLSDNQRMDKLEKTNSSLRKQNLDLTHTCKSALCQATRELATWSEPPGPDSGLYYSLHVHLQE